MSSLMSARSLAAAATAQVLRDGITLDAALAALSSHYAGNTQVQSAVRSLSYGAVRGYFRYAAILRRLSKSRVNALDKGVLGVLCVALFELEDERTPEYAVVDAAVRSAKHGDAARAAGLVNAVLRRYLRERQAIDHAVAANPETRYAAPQWLADRVREDWPAQWEQLLQASDARAPMWLRVNSRTTSAAEYLDMLHGARIPGRIEARVPQALMLHSPCDVHTLPGFAGGTVSVQDLGAQCVAFPLELAPGQRVLDACAAPGGKTALIAEREPRLAKLVALDVDAARLQRVRENLERGKLQAHVVAGDASKPAAWWDGEPFDRILLDAPCSALGVIRRHPDIRVRKAPQAPEQMAAQQVALLQSVWGMLAPGGRLVYATCTITKSESRDVIARFLRGAADARVISASRWPGWPGFGAADEFGLQIMPGEAGADGFYYAALNKQ